MSITVIVPCLNEEAGIIQTLQDLRLQNPDEIIVSDGGSSDATVKVAAPFCDKVVTGGAGRAAQMNRGAAEASGDVLLFLHADTRLPADGISTIRNLLAEDPQLIGGRFRVSFDDTSFRFRMISYYTRFKAFSYGDQGFFILKNSFHEIGGFNEQLLFEDADFFRRMNSRGPVRILKSATITSARRFQKVGFLRQKAINIFLSLVMSAGFDARSLARRIYADVR